jgi:hypothetical protein
MPCDKNGFSLLEIGGGFIFEVSDACYFHTVIIAIFVATSQEISGQTHLESKNLDVHF